MRGKPSLARSSTGCEKSSLPSNQGFTVCWSVETTSIRWLPSSDRTWLENTSAATRWSLEGARRRAVHCQPLMEIKASSAKAPANCHIFRDGHLIQLCRTSAPLEARRDDWIRSLKAAGAAYATELRCKAARNAL